MDVEESRKGAQEGLEDDDDRNNTNEIMWFRMLRELSELLMLPKDMLLETPIRQEVITCSDLTCFHLMLP